MSFSGFPREGLAFLEGLAADNSKSYFDAHRGTYETALLEPAKEFVVDLGADLQRRVSPEIHAEPRVNGSIFRINRDIRFSRDKRPYKTHLDLFFWEGAGRSRDCPGFFFRLAPRALVLGAGKHGFDTRELAAYRAAVADERAGSALERALAKTGHATVGGEATKRVPRGFDAGHPRADLLKRTGLYVYEEIEPPPPKTISAAFVGWCAARLERLAPVHRWLVETL